MFFSIILFAKHLPLFFCFFFCVWFVLYLHKSRIRTTGSINIKYLIHLLHLSRLFIYLFTTNRVAVDYTSSNLQKDYKIDLHHINKNAERASPYQMAIRRIGNILQTYDSDKKYPLFGFGAWGRFKGNSSSSDPTTSHAFNVNTDMLYKLNEEVDGIDGLEKTYSESIAKLRENQIFRLSGPTYFSGILKDAKQMAQESWNNYVFNKGKLEYFIFLIITDGAVSSQDMLPTINQIVDIATKGLPLSIIIVGVGKGPFDSMNLLDGDFLEDIRGIVI